MKQFIPLFFGLMVINASSFSQVKTMKEYYPSGKIKSILHEGNFNGCNMKVSTDSFYYESGRMKTTIAYDNRKDKKEAGCHATWTTETIIQYYPNGKMKSLSQKKYAYEGEACSCGKRIVYDEKGGVKEKSVKTDCYDQKPCNNQ